jgi:hypothetical protein
MYTRMLVDQIAGAILAKEAVGLKKTGAIDIHDFLSEGGQLKIDLSWYEDNGFAFIEQGKIKDAWGNPIMANVSVDPSGNGNVEVISCGPDGICGSRDDIASPR